MFLVVIVRHRYLRFLILNYKYFILATNGDDNLKCYKCDTQLGQNWCMDSDDVIARGIDAQANCTGYQKYCKYNNTGNNCFPL